MDEGRRAAMPLYRRFRAWRVVDVTSRSSAVRAGRMTFAANSDASARWIRSGNPSPSVASAARSTSRRLLASAEKGTKPRWSRTRARMALSVAGRDKASRRMGGTSPSWWVRWMTALWGVCVGSSKNRPVRRKLQRCSAVHSRVSEPRACRIASRSASARAQSFRIWSRSPSSGLAANGSAIKVERGLFDGAGKFIGRRAGVDGGGVEAFVSEQLGQFDKLTRMLTQPGQGEGVAQAVGGDSRAFEAGATHQAGEGILNRAHRQRFIPGRAEHWVSWGDGSRILLEQLAQRPAGCGVERHLAFLKTLAMTDENRAGPLPQGDIGAAQRRDLADAQTGLQHELDQGVIAMCEAMGTRAGGAQQAMHLGRGHADRLAVAGQANRLNLASNVGGGGTTGFGPSQETADCFQATIDGGRFELAPGEHVLAPGNDVVFDQPGQLGLGTVQGCVPSCELKQVVAVAAACGGREIGGGEMVEEGLEPGRKVGHWGGSLYCTQSQPP